MTSYVNTTYIITLHSSLVFELERTSPLNHTEDLQTGSWTQYRDKEINVQVLYKQPLNQDSLAPVNRLWNMNCLKVPDRKCMVWTNLAGNKQHRSAPTIVATVTHRLKGVMFLNSFQGWLKACILVWIKMGWKRGHIQYMINFIP